MIADDPTADLDWSDVPSRDGERRRLASMVKPGESSLQPDGQVAFRCPSCGQIMNAKRRQIGQAVVCGSCSMEFPVPDVEMPASQGAAAEVRLPAARSKDLRTADDLRSRTGPRIPAAKVPQPSDLDTQFQALIRQELERLQGGSSEATSAGSSTPSSPSVDTSGPSRKKKPPPLGEHGEVVSSPKPSRSDLGDDLEVPHQGTVPTRHSGRVTPNRAPDAPLPTLVTMDSIETDADVAKHWGNQAVVPTSRLNWLAIVVIMGAIAGAGYFGYQAFMDWQQESAEEAESITRVEDSMPAPDPANAARKDVLNALQGFLESVSAEDKAQFVRGGASQLPLMKNYYALNDLESRLLDSDSITTERLLLEKHWFHQVKGEYRETLEPFLANLEERDDGSYLLDWKSWVGYNPTSLQAFAERGEQNAETFRLKVSLSGYHRYDYVDAATYRSFFLQDQEETVRLYGYALINSPVGEKLIALFRKLKDEKDQKEARLILSIRFDPNVDPKRGQVLIEDLVSEHWIETLPAD